MEKCRCKDFTCLRSKKSGRVYLFWGVKYVFSIVEELPYCNETCNIKEIVVEKWSIPTNENEEISMKC